MSLTRLITCDNAIDANLIKSKLEIEGIHCFLHNENFTNLMPQYFNILGSGIQVMVSSNDYDKALQITNINKHRLICPECGSIDIMNKMDHPMKRVWLFLMALLLVIPVGNLLNSYHCNNCGTDFKK